MDDLYEKISNLRQDNKALKDEVDKWKAVDKRTPFYVILIGIFVFIPIGMIVGHFILAN